jgi:hypothetical protein
MVWVDLMLDTGELVRIECPRKFETALHESIEHAMKRGDWWSRLRFEGCSAEYLGVSLDRVAMRRVVGVLD